MFSLENQLHVHEVMVTTNGMNFKNVINCNPPLDKIS